MTRCQAKENMVISMLKVQKIDKRKFERGLQAAFERHLKECPICSNEVYEPIPLNENLYPVSLNSRMRS